MWALDTYWQVLDRGSGSLEGMQPFDACLGSVSNVDSGILTHVTRLWLSYRGQELALTPHRFHLLE